MMIDGKTFYENLPAEKKEQAEKAGLTEEKIIKTFDSLKNTAEAAARAMRQIADVFRKLWEEALRTYPNRRVVYLALHGKPLVRKKNRNRIIKWMEKQGGPIDV